MTRQQIRAQERADAFRRVNAAYGLEPRRARRGIARAWATQAWRKRAALTAVSCGLLALFSLGATPSAQAQGSRKDDIVFNAQGRPMAGATVRVCTSGATGQPCAPLAQIYSDAALTQALANPLSTDGLGNYSFYAAPGRYMIEISGPGITTKQLPNVILPSDPSSPTFTSVTTTSGISAFSLSLTGNLTVNGSTAVVGSLTVGGAPVPSTNADNQWTAGQRFKGPDPWRDFTAYMPAGGCSSTDNTAYYDYGTMSSGSHTLTITTSNQNFKTGCGVAVLNAGSTSTIAKPGAGCTISSIARSSNVVTVTCAAAHGVFVESYGVAFGMVVAGVTDTSFNGTFTVASVPDATHITYAQTAANGTSSGGTVNTLWGYAHGVTGSTTYNYKLVSVDGNMGYSAATGPITITNGNATLSATNLNYNWINVPPVQNSYMVAVYSDKGPGGAYSCIGVTFNMGFDDYGLYAYPNCPLFLPATPPSSAGNQTLNSIIIAGSGAGATLTLADAATNSVSGSNPVFHDETSFLKSCLTDVIADQANVGGSNTSSYGCYIPPVSGGMYWMNGLMPTATLSPANSVKIDVAGTLNFDLLPWFINKGYNIEGVGGGGAGGTFFHEGTVSVVFQSQVPAAFVLREGASQIQIKNFALSNLRGYGIWAGDTWDAGGGVAGLTLDNLSISVGNGGMGVPMWFDNNVIGVWMNHDTLIPSDSGGLPAIAFTMSDYGGNTNCCYYINDLTSDFHGFRIDAPAGNLTGGGITGPTVHGWLSESLHDSYMINHDNGPNAPGTGGIIAEAIELYDVDSADAYSGPLLHERYGSLNPPGGSSTSAGLFLQNSNIAQIMSCGPDPSCDTPGVDSLSLSAADANVPGSLGGEAGFSANGGRVKLNNVPLLMTGGKNQYGVGDLAQAMLLPPAYNFTVSSTGSGSLSSGTWCAIVYGYDSKVIPGYTVPSHEVCQAVGASSSIVYSWGVAGYMGEKSWRIYYGIGSGNETKYYDTSGAQGFTLTTDGGTVAAQPTGTPNAYLSALYFDGFPSCLLCGGGSSMPLGIGVWPVQSNGIKLDVGGGTIRGQGGIQAGTDTAFNASPRGSYNAFLPNLTSAAGTYQRMTLDKAITVTRFQLVLGTAGSGCTTQSTVSVTDGTNSVTLTTANGTAIYDSGAVSQGFAAAANLDIKIATAASGCTTAPQNANVTVQYRMQ